jgi:hypothetical protein
MPLGTRLLTLAASDAEGGVNQNTDSIGSNVRWACPGIFQRAAKHRTCRSACQPQELSSVYLQLRLQKELYPKTLSAMRGDKMKLPAAPQTGSPLRSDKLRGIKAKFAEANPPSLARP